MDVLPFPYERFFGRVSEESAKKVLDRGWRIGRYPPVFINSKIDWALYSEKERSWNYHMHCLDMVDALLQAYCDTKKEIYLRVSVKVALDWIVDHLVEIEERFFSPFAWYDMAVGLRSYRLSYIFDAAVRLNILDKEYKNLFWSALLKHQEYLSCDKNIAFHSNHGYYQIAGQLAMGRRFEKISEVMANAKKQGDQRIDFILKSQFSSDGIHKEHSPDYHRMVYETLKALTESGLINNEKTIKCLVEIEEALSWFIFPNGKVVNFGDSDSRCLQVDQLDSVETKWLSSAMQYMVTEGQVGELPLGFTKAFSEGGYFICRKPLESEPESLLNYSYLAQSAAFHSRTHKHADDLTFVWFEYGRNILVDAGRYGYVGKTKQGSALWLDGHWYSDPNRIYCESTRAHNTLEFNGKNYKRRGVKPYGSALRRWKQCNETGIVAVETECKQFHSIRQARVLVFLPSKWLLVFDWFFDNKNEMHEVKQWFHLDPELSILLKDDCYQIDMPEAIRPLQVCSLLLEPMPSLVYHGEKEPDMQGWWSGSERDIVSNDAWCFKLNDVSTGSFATLFSFSDFVQRDQKRSRVNVSGRRGHFRWIDMYGSHDLMVSRPATGEMTVSYKNVIKD